jgi:predicted helicase
MERKLAVFADMRTSNEELADKYGLRSSGSWSLSNARAAAREGAATAPQIVAYRPFDERWSEFSALTIDRPRGELLDHVAGHQNLCLLVPRQIGIATWRHAFVATVPAESCLVSSDTKSQNYVFPARAFVPGAESQENLSPNFRAFLDARYEHHYTPEEIFGYIYAVLHAPTYRTRYGEFLRIDFPRVPFPELAGDFEMLSVLGWALMQAHLLRELPRRGFATYQGQGNHTVDAVRYLQVDQSVSINKTQSFKPVPQAVWDFYIGGYQVLDKYLKSRKGRVLSLDEINHVGAISDSLAFTIEQMARIDEAYQAAFPERG